MLASRIIYAVGIALTVGGVLLQSVQSFPETPLSVHHYTEPVPVRPLQTFLESPVTSVHAILYRGGCHNSQEFHARYVVRDGEMFGFPDVSTEAYRYPPRMLERDRLNSVLREINGDPSTFPNTEDFALTPDDSLEYLKHMIVSTPADGIDPGSDEYRRYRAVLDAPAFTFSLSTLEMRELLEYEEDSESTAWTSQTVVIVNARGDTLTLKGSSAGFFRPWGLPWRVTPPSGQTFETYSLAFSRLYVDLFPEERELERSGFSNEDLILHALMYLSSPEAVVESGKR